MIRFAQLDSSLAQSWTQTFTSIAGALLCAAVMLGAALPLTPIA